MEKAERVNRILNTLDSEEELLRRMPEINKIDDDDIREGTIRTYMDGCPDTFWERGSSSSGKYHAPDEHGEWGNVIHTKRVFKEYSNISESYLHADVITPYERDCGKSAALIHDMMKYGWPSDDNYHTVRDRDLIAASVAKHIGGLPDDVTDLIVTHMGPWGKGPTPSTKNQWLVHLADKSASGTKQDVRAIYYAPDEILDIEPDIPVIESD